jgi:paired amphipathic helix protein Sin3a
MTHRKNTFEEQIHKCEEERHEFSVHLQAMQRTIAILEPLVARLETMTAEERALFKLKPDFGGSGRCLYERTIKRVYGRDAALEVLTALQDGPAVAVPVVLARLRQKDEEWRRLQREWSRTWREVDHKNFYKSLDHQGINSKQADKKSITAKAFVIDIETIKAQREADNRKLGTPSSSRQPNRNTSAHLVYDLSDLSVLYDTLKLGYSYLDHSHASYTLAERRHIARFLRDFVTLLTMQQPHAFDDPNNQLDATNGDVPDHHDHTNGRRTSMGESHTGNSAGTSRHGSPRGIRQSPTKGKSRASPEPEAEDEPDELWINEAPPPEDDPGFHPHLHCRPFFANTTFYTLLRIIQVRKAFILRSLRNSCERLSA